MYIHFKLYALLLHSFFAQWNNTTNRKISLTIEMWQMHEWLESTIAEVEKHTQQTICKASSTIRAHTMTLTMEPILSDTHLRVIFFSSPRKFFRSTWRWSRNIAVGYVAAQRGCGFHAGCWVLLFDDSLQGTQRQKKKNSHFCVHGNCCHAMLCCMNKGRI